MIKATSNLKFGPFEFYGVSTQADGKNMEVKQASDKEFKWFSNSLYMFYPLKKRLQIAFGKNEMSSFGTNNRVSEGSIYRMMSQPEGMDEADFKPVKVIAGHTVTVLQSEDGTLYQTGGFDGINSVQKLTKLKWKADKVKQIFVGY